MTSPTSAQSKVVDDKEEDADMMEKEDVDEMEKEDVDEMEKEEDETEEVSECVRSRCSPCMVKKVNDQLNSDQKKDVQEIGLGGILSWKCTMLRWSCIDAVLEVFDPKRFILSLPKRIIQIELKDVTEIMGLKSEGRKAPKGTAEDAKALRKELDVSTTAQLHKKLEKMQGADDTFKRIYALFVLKALLVPTMCTNIPNPLFHIVKDINSLAEINLAKFMLDALKKGVKRKTRNGQLGVGGCVLFLKLFFLENVIPEDERLSHSEPRMCPRMLHWDDKAISDRITIFQENGWLEDPKSYFVTPRGGVASSDAHSSVHTGCNNQNDKLEAMRGEMNDLKELMYQVSKGVPSTSSKQDENIEAMRGEIDELKTLVHNFVKIATDVFAGISKKDELVEEAKEEIPVDVNPQEDHCHVDLEEQGADVEVNLDMTAGVEQNLDKVDVVEPEVNKGKMQVQDDEAVSSNILCCPKRTRNDVERQQGAQLRTPYTPYGLKKRARSKNVVIFTDQDKLKVKSFLPQEVRNKRVRTGPTTARELILDRGQDKDETLVKIGWCSAERKFMKDLWAGGWISSVVINCWAGLKSTDMDVDLKDRTKPIWFLSTWVAQVIGEDPNYPVDKLVIQYFNPRRGLVGDYSNCKKIFIPVLLDNHWYSAVIDLEKSIIYILDSKMARKCGENPRNVDIARAEYVEGMLPVIDKVLLHIGGSLHEKRVTDFKMIHADWVPQQRNGKDCGVFVMFYMQEIVKLIDEKDKKPLPKFEGKITREMYALEMILHPENKINIAEKLIGNVVCE